MYVRILIVVWAFAGDLGRQLAPALIGLAVLGCAAGAAMIVWHPQSGGGRSKDGEDMLHPLEIRVAVAFAALFVALTVATQLTAEHLGSAWLLVLAVLVGFTDTCRSSSASPAESAPAFRPTSPSSRSSSQSRATTW